MSASLLTGDTLLRAAFDPIDAIADCCATHGHWLHVDGEDGAALARSPTTRHLQRGIERADSVICEAHKMLLQPAPVTMTRSAHCRPRSAVG